MHATVCFVVFLSSYFFFFFFQAEDGIRDHCVTGVQTCALLISSRRRHTRSLCDWSSDVCSSDLLFERIGHEMEEETQHADAILRRILVPVRQIGRASCRERCRSRWSPYH